MPTPADHTFAGNLQQIYSNEKRGVRTRNYGGFGESITKVFFHTSTAINAANTSNEAIAQISS